MAKFLPFIGEVVTALESAILITAAGLVKVCGDDKSASELADAAGNSWTEYAETNVLATPINIIVQEITRDYDKGDRLEKSLGNTASSFVDGIPVAGHIKGIVHYAMDDDEKGNQSMLSASRTTAVLGAGLLTGGLGGGLVGGASAGVGTGIVYDGTTTLIDKEVHGDDGKLHGIFAFRDLAKMSPNQVVGTVFGVVGDGMTGAAGAQMGKNSRSSRSGQRNLEQTYKQSNDLKNTGVDHKTATKLTMETAQESQKAQAALKKPTNHATSKVCDTASGETGVGHSEHYRVQKSIDKRLDGTSKNAARRDACTYDKPSHLETKYPDVKQAIPKRHQATCAEHTAFDNLAKKNPEYATKNVNTATTYYKKNGGHITKPRCGNCSAYGPGMGNVITDCIPEGTRVPPSAYVMDGYLKHATVAATAGITLATNKSSN